MDCKFSFPLVFVACLYLICLSLLRVLVSLSMHLGWKLVSVHSKDINVINLIFT